MKKNAQRFDSMQAVEDPQSVLQHNSPSKTSPIVVSLADEYKKLEASVPVHFLLDRVTYTAPVNFVEAMATPRHRWFPYKEGFSPHFVRDFITEYCPNARGERLRVIDPFSGVGTTVIESAVSGNIGLGLDVSPLAIFVSKTKAISPEKTSLKFIARELEKIGHLDEFEPVAPPENETVLSYFERDYLTALLQLKAAANACVDASSRALVKLAFLSIVEQFSTHRKAGNGLKRKTKIAYKQFGGTPLKQVSDAASNLAAIFLRDLATSPIAGKAEFIPSSSLEADLPAEHFDIALTSPPYANCFDYSKIYTCELWLGDFFNSAESQKQFRRESVRSHVHARWDNRHIDFGSDIVNQLIAPHLETLPLWSNAIPTMLRGYFSDIARVLRTISTSLKPGARFGLVVSNSAYGGIPIATDLLICEMAKANGLVPEEIRVYRKIVPSSQQFIALASKDLLRESLVILRKS